MYENHAPIPTDEEMRKKFLSNLRKEPSGCMTWSKSRNRNGYGTLVFLGETLAHRVSYLLFKGNIPSGLFVCHHCDNPPCCNPVHLFLGDRSDNAKDCVRKDRHGTATLTMQTALDIKMKYEKIPVVGSRKLCGAVEALCTEYGISKSQMHRIKNGERWAVLNNHHLELSHQQ